MLDDCRKSTEEINWNCTWAATVAQVYERDSLMVFRHYPEAYLTSLRRNVKKCFWPDTEAWPFDTETTMRTSGFYRGPLALYNFFTAGERPPGVGRPWLAYLLPGLLGFGVF